MKTTFEGVVHQNTAKAVLFQSHFWDAPVWLPRSQTSIYKDGEEEENVVVKVNDWLCNKRGMLEFTYYNEKEIGGMNAE